MMLCDYCGEECKPRAAHDGPNHWVRDLGSTYHVRCLPEAPNSRCEDPVRQPEKFEIDSAYLLDLAVKQGADLQLSHVAILLALDELRIGSSCRPLTVTVVQHMGGGQSREVQIGLNPEARREVFNQLADHADELLPYAREVIEKGRDYERERLAKDRAVQLLRDVLAQCHPDIGSTVTDIGWRVHEFLQEEGLT